MFNKFLLLTDNQIKDIFDNLRNIGICGAIFVAADWQLSQIKSLHTSVDFFGASIFVLLMIIGFWLFLIAQIQAYRKWQEFGVKGIPLAICSTLYSLLTITLLASVFVH
jgi:hypothetical protein